VEPQEALAAGPGSVERERFLFRTGRGDAGELPPNNWRSVFGGPAWTRVDGSDQWYLHNFDASQPDFNWRNPEVGDYFAGVLRFWFDRGVDGIRIDVAHMLFKFISLSYAIGEWARVWPLNHVFKWFGGYFVRRRYREPLYHAILSKFVQTITKHGVTQGIFIEGGLTRDGAFQKPKLGMLDYLVTAKRDPDFTAPLYIIPTAVNYDRVLEDRNLTQELLRREERATKREKLATTFDYLFKNFFRGVFRRFKRYGYAIVTFGSPISVDEFAREHPEILSDSFDTRKPAVQLLADKVMGEISGAIPVTPVRRRDASASSPRRLARSPPAAMARIAFSDRLALWAR
jgi:1-acyl-sn-glycerol-3-phosphate acyltransferase